MKITDITYNSFVEIVKEKINNGTIKPHHTNQRFTNDSAIKVKSINSINKERLFKEIKKILKKIEHNNYSINIKFHQKTKTYIIKIIDNETKKVIKEAPIEKILDMISFMEELINKKNLIHRR